MNQPYEIPSAPKVEVSAEQIAHSYALQYYHESDHEFEIVKDAHIAGQSLQTSSLQQENVKLREEVRILRSALEEIASYKYPHSSIVKATIIADNALNKKS